MELIQFQIFVDCESEITNLYNLKYLIKSGCIIEKFILNDTSSTIKKKTYLVELEKMSQYLDDSRI